jgi:hypothetical protein
MPLVRIENQNEVCAPGAPGDDAADSLAEHAVAERALRLAAVHRAMAKYAPLNMSPQELIEYTPEWVGDRFPDGRPRVPDDLLERMVRFHPASSARTG